jgi:hypothetical protein
MHRGDIGRMSSRKVLDSGTGVPPCRSDHCGAFQPCLPPDAQRAGCCRLLSVNAIRSIMLSRVDSLHQKAWR